MALTVTLLGGESSGKTTLAQALQPALQAQDITSTLVPELLRTWCEQHGRAPQAHEQTERAQAQSLAIASAAQDATVQVVLADTTALVIAAYSELYFEDRSLWPHAIEQQRRYSLTLLMGLDLPWVPDGLFRDSPAVRDAIDRRLRGALQGAGLPFTPVYGRGPQRLAQALRAVQGRIGSRLDVPLVAADALLEQGSGRWNCDNCSDPDCEHRLFSGLVRQRQAGTD